MNGVIALKKARDYTDSVANSLGSLKGAPCTIKSSNKVDDETTIVFEWEGTNGATETSQIVVFDGEDGASITNMTIDTDRNLICTLSDGNTINAGQIPTVSGEVETLVEEKVQEQIETQLDDTIQEKVDKAVEEALQGDSSSEGVEDEIDSWF